MMQPNGIALLRQPPSVRRRALTLVEMMLVIAIIAILISLATAAGFRVIRSQDNKVTDTTLTKLHSELDQQIKQVIDQAKEEFKNGKVPSQLWSHGSVQNNQDKALELWIRLRLRQEFPKSFQE